MNAHLEALERELIEQGKNDPAIGFRATCDLMKKLEQAQIRLADLRAVYARAVVDRDPIEYGAQERAAAHLGVTAETLSKVLRRRPRGVRISP